MYKQISRYKFEATAERQQLGFEGKFDFNVKRLLEREHAREDWSKKIIENAHGRSFLFLYLD